MFRKKPKIDMRDYIISEHEKTIALLMRENQWLRDKIDGEVE